MIVGIDLAGVETRASVFCSLDKKLNADASILYTDKEVIQKILETKPAVIAIDAPLALPLGRESLEKRSNIHLRECDKELLKMKIKFFPITLGPMRKLTERGIRLRETLEKKGFEVIETYPGAVQDMLKIPRKQKGLEKLRKGLIEIGVKGIENCRNGDELDAVTCALVGKLYLDEKFIAIGDPKEVLMILPKVD